MSNLVIKTKGMEFASVDRDIEIVLVKYLLAIAVDKPIFLSKYTKKLNELFPDSVYLNPKKKNYAPILWAVKNGITKLAESGILEKTEVEGAMNSYYLFKVANVKQLQLYAKTPYTVIDVTEEELQGWFKHIIDTLETAGKKEYDSSVISVGSLF